MTPFDLVEPQTLGEALELLDRGDADVRPASGCTALMLMMKASMLKPARLISLRRLAPRFSAIETAGAALNVGALVTLAALERSALVRRELPVLAHALRTLANVRVRNQATLGGHLAHADPHMDLPPLLTALDAEVVIAGRHGERVIPVAQLITGYMETALAGAELITAVRIPLAPQSPAGPQEWHQASERARGERTPSAHHAYLKVTSRSADDWPSLGVAVSLRVMQGKIERAYIVIGAAVDRPTHLQSAESVLRGAAVSEQVIARAAESAAAEAKPIADQHGSAAYKKQLVRVYTARALRQALDLPRYGSPT